MFGYIRVQKSELKLREYEAYKSVYCGLCRQMGRDYSVLSRFLLSYDCTFYAVFIMALRRSCSGFDKGRCRFNPLKKCSLCRCDDDAMSRAAALSVILSYYKIIDDIHDSGVAKRTACKIIKPVFSRWRRKAARRFPELDALASEMLSAQLSAERNPDCTLDMAADPTAKLLAEVLALEAQTEAQRRIYRQIGYGLGRFIYLIDAADDYKKDINNNNFNPFAGFGKNAAGVMRANLSQALAMTYDAYNLLTLVDFKGIIDNIILMGLPAVQEEILSEGKENNEGSV